MNILSILINNLDGYTLGHIQKRLASENSKAFNLFQLYKNNRGNEVGYDDDFMMKKLYDNEPAKKGTYYRLKNRIVNDIYQVLVELNTAEGKTLFQGEYHLMLYKIFMEKRIGVLAEYNLLKAIKIAEDREQYELLDILYGEMISFSKDTLKHDPEEYLVKRRSNFKMFNNLRTIDEILAIVTYRLKSTQNLSGRFNISEEVERVLNEFASDDEISRSNLFKLKFYKTISQILVQQKKFEELIDFINKTRAEFVKLNFFAKSTHDVNIEQLVYLTNAFLVQGEFDKVIEVGKILYEELLKYDKFLFNDYIYFYYQAQINSYAMVDVQKALELQLEVLKKKDIIKDSYFIVFNYANLAYLYFVNSEHKSVLKALQKVNLNDYYSKVDDHLKAELLIMELMVRMDLADVNTFELRLDQIKAIFENELENVEYREKVLLEIIEEASVSPYLKTNSKLKKLISQYRSTTKNEAESGVFNLDFWVDQKFKLS